MPTWWEAWGSLHKTAGEELSPADRWGHLEVSLAKCICGDYRPAGKLTEAEDSPLKLRTQGHHARLWCWHWGNRLVFLRLLCFMVLCYSAGWLIQLYIYFVFPFAFSPRSFSLFLQINPTLSLIQMLTLEWCRHLMVWTLKQGVKNSASKGGGKYCFG